MNKLFLAGAALLAAVATGFWLGQGRPADQADDARAGRTSDDREILYWAAPMDPDYRREQPGKSPMGMDLVPVYADAADADVAAGIVAVDPRIVASLGVRTAVAERSPLPRVIDTVGFVEFAEDTLTTVTSRTAGWVERLAVAATGATVQPGQVLYELYSPELVNAQREYLAVLRGGNAALIAAGRERLRALGLSPADVDRLDAQRQVRQRQVVVAQRAGVITALGIHAGEYVVPGTPIMTIAALSPVWVRGAVFARQAAWLAAGQDARIDLAGYPGREWTGVVDYVYPEVDAQTRTLAIRVVLNNDAGLLRPGMYARIRIDAGASEPVTHVPRAAVIRGGRADRVVLALGDGRFRSVRVEPGVESGARMPVAGISPGDRVVTSGQFLIDSEANLDTALRRLEGPVDEPVRRVTVAAVVEGWRIGARRLTVAHAPVPEWSWPAMSMGLEVADSALLENLELGQSVRIDIEARRDGSYVVTAIDRSDDRADHALDHRHVEPMR